MITSGGIKVVMLGNTSVGKTSILERFANESFDSDSIATNSANVIIKALKLPDDPQQIYFRIWDTAGQEKFRSMASMYYKDAAAAVIVYDVTNEESLEGAKYWIQELKGKGPENILMVLTGNKMDLVEDLGKTIDKVDRYIEELKKERLNIMEIKVSAKSNLNIDKVFIGIAKSIKKKEAVVVSGEDFIKIDIPRFNKKKKCC